MSTYKSLDRKCDKSLNKSKVGEGYSRALTNIMAVRKSGLYITLTKKAVSSRYWHLLFKGASGCRRLLRHTLRNGASFLWRWTTLHSSSAGLVRPYFPNSLSPPQKQEKIGKVVDNKVRASGGERSESPFGWETHRLSGWCGSQ